MKKIIFVTLTLGNAGAERVSSLLINNWAQKGYEIEVIQTQSDDTSLNYDMTDKISYKFVKSKIHFMPLRRIDEAVKVSKILKQNPDAIGMAFVRRSILTLALAAFFSGNRIIVSERNDPRSVPKGRIAKSIRNMIFKNANACVFQTQEAMDYFPEKARKKGYIISNPINPDLPQINSGERKKRIIAVCRLSPQKNLEMLIRAFGSIAHLYPEYTLEIFGEGPERDKLQELIEKLNMERQIILKGFSRTIYDEMNNSKMYVSSSNYEGISNSMLEALAMGLPSVVTDCPAGGARMVIKNGINGILVPVNNQEQMSRALSELLGDEDGLKRISLEARKIREEYSIDEIGNQWIKVIDKVLNGD